MNSLPLKETEHDYYCSTEEFYKGTREIYHTWSDFHDEYGDDPDDSSTHLFFRFDIVENPEIQGRFKLYLFSVQQRKGIFVPITIHNITEKDLPHITLWLSDRFDYLKTQIWPEIVELQKKQELEL